MTTPPQNSKYCGAASTEKGTNIEILPQTHDFVCKLMSLSNSPSAIELSKSVKISLTYLINKKQKNWPRNRVKNSFVLKIQPFLSKPLIYLVGVITVSVN